MIESSTKLKPWRDTVARAARTIIPKPLTGPVRVDVAFVMPRPKAWGKNRHDPMIQRPDTDKLLRGVLDALTGVAFQDDSQVTVLRGLKRRATYGEPTGAYIQVMDSTRYPTD